MLFDLVYFQKSFQGTCSLLKQRYSSAFFDSLFTHTSTTTCSCLTELSDHFFTDEAGQFWLDRTHNKPAMQAYWKQTFLFAWLGFIIRCKDFWTVLVCMVSLLAWPLISHFVQQAFVFVSMFVLLCISRFVLRQRTLLQKRRIVEPY